MAANVGTGSEDFVHLLFSGETTSPWHVGMASAGVGRRRSLTTRTDYLWGRGVRGPVLRYLWRAHCSGLPECGRCGSAQDCPYWNLSGSGEDGEFKGRPRAVFTNLYFIRPRKGTVPLSTGRGEIAVEYIEEGTRFWFEVILMGGGARFEGDMRSAVEATLRILGWGGLCNEGMGRGIITSVERSGFADFERRYVEPTAELIGREATFSVDPPLILERLGRRGVYTGIQEEGFLEKLRNSVAERYWQFCGEHIRLELEDVRGRAGVAKVRGWGGTGHRSFVGLSGEISLRVAPSLETARALALARYGVGKYKNQGFGSLRLITSHG